MMWGYDGFGFGGGAMGFGMLLFWGLIIAAIVVLVLALARGFGGTPGASEPRAHERTPLDILGERYARGEIGKSEFEQKRSELAAG